MLEDDQIYVVVDIETDGPLAAVNSMISLAAVACDSTQLLGEFNQNLEPLPELERNLITTAWWQTQPEAFKSATEKPGNPKTVLESFIIWIHNLNAQVIFVSHPLSFDYFFVAWYLQKFSLPNPFEDEDLTKRTLDLASFISGKLERPYTLSSRTKLPGTYLAGMPEHSHKAIEDARGYAVLLQTILKN